MDGLLIAMVGAFIFIVVTLLILKLKNPDARMIESARNLIRDYFGSKS